MTIHLPQEVREQLSLSLKDFEAPGPDLHSIPLTRVPIDPQSLPLPAIAAFVLTERGGRHLPPGDKTAWDIAFRYAGTDCTLALQKFGLRLYVDARVVEAKAAPEFAKPLIGKLQRGVQLIEKPVLRPLADEQLATGNVTIANQVGWLRGTYEYFVAQARESFASAAKPAERVESPQGGPLESAGVLGLLSQTIQGRATGARYTLAAVNAYFSLLEHELVLCLPFVGFDPGGGALTEFIGARWGDKIKSLFAVGTDPDASRCYNSLHGIAETYRNPYSHGGFDKEGAAVWVQLPDVGAVPARLSDVRDDPHFELFPADEHDLEEIVRTFEAVDAWLNAAATKDGMRFAAAGLHVMYDEDSRQTYAAAMVSDEAFEKLLDHQSALQTDIENFDL